MTQLLPSKQETGFDQQSAQTKLSEFLVSLEVGSKIIEELVQRIKQFLNEINLHKNTQIRLTDKFSQQKLNIFFRQSMNKLNSWLNVLSEKCNNQSVKSVKSDVAMPSIRQNCTLPRNQLKENHLQYERLESSLPMILSIPVLVKDLKKIHLQVEHYQTKKTTSGNQDPSIQLTDNGLNRIELKDIKTDSDDFCLDEQKAELQTFYRDMKFQQQPDTNHLVEQEDKKADSQSENQQYETIQDLKRDFSQFQSLRNNDMNDSSFFDQCIKQPDSQSMDQSQMTIPLEDESTDKVLTITIRNNENACQPANYEHFSQASTINYQQKVIQYGLNEQSLNIVKQSDFELQSRVNRYVLVSQPLTLPQQQQINYQRPQSQTYLSDKIEHEDLLKFSQWTDSEIFEIQAKQKKSYQCVQIISQSIEFVQSIVYHLNKKYQPVQNALQAIQTVQQVNEHILDQVCMLKPDLSTELASRSQLQSNLHNQISATRYYLVDQEK